jgi:hypothetical protein
MRPVETLLLIVNLLTFFALAVPLLREAGWTRYAAVVAPVLAGAQAIVEGPRWQMFLAYALSGVLFLVWLLQSGEPAGKARGHGRVKWVAAQLGAGALGALALVASIALPVILPVFRFPHPTGPYAIGTLTYHWVDAARSEAFTADPNDRRELMVQIWYPAKQDSSFPRAPWIQDADAFAPALARFLNLPDFTFGHLKYITTNAITSAPVADDEPSYPVLLFLEGTTGFRQQNTFQVEELVSRGYIVAAIDQPYAAAVVIFPDGRQVAGVPVDQLKRLIRQNLSLAETSPTLDGPRFENGIIPYLAQDAIFTLDQLAGLNQADPNGILTGTLDLQRAGIFGHSGGGIVGGEACRLEPRLRACLLEDAPMTADVVQAGLLQPAMWITRDAETMRLEGWPQSEIDEHQTTMRGVFESLPGDGYFVRLPGMFHLDMTDLPFLSPLASRLGLSGPIGAERAHRIIDAYSVAFFDRYLKGVPAVLLDQPAEEYPEVLFETRRSDSAPSTCTAIPVSR